MHSVTFMFASCIWILLLLCTLLKAAPVPESSGEAEVIIGDPDFQKFLSDNLELSDKMYKLAAAEQNVTCPFCKDEQLVLFKEQLNISFPHLEECLSRTFQLFPCLDKVDIGLKFYHVLLANATASASKTAEIVTDISNLSANIRQQMTLLGITMVMYPNTDLSTLTLSPTEDMSIVKYIILSNFRAFLETVMRALQSKQCVQC
ncbi:myelomonocytic growth factor-like [Protopterus annectens]|uniref:myelomonocytic growth factor-like n=1 Tax=Protopterus annectens TaxID=7888 RepID=UPI001CFA5FDC|nr:myelomonocytic growth factor-like [Protopterus annectens]